MLEQRPCQLLRWRAPLLHYPLAHLMSAFTLNCGIHSSRLPGATALSPLPESSLLQPSSPSERKLQVHFCPSFPSSTELGSARDQPSPLSCLSSLKRVTILICPWTGCVQWVWPLVHANILISGIDSHPQPVSLKSFPHASPFLLHFVTDFTARHWHVLCCWSIVLWTRGVLG